MSIEAISKEQFYSFKPQISVLRHASSHQVEWYKDTHANVIGTVIFDRIDNEWLWVILGRNRSGQFRGIDLTGSAETREAAAGELLQKMAEIEKTGQSMSPQGHDHGSTSGETARGWLE